ncbi:hypothetical protein C7S18_09325 [Ahniella affigens]|uniref:Porin n=1 Tax=Ahniella affigens TaxID=2021234 RepID=A0A2P1PRD1_9GAMM|nr:hypothetical protein [Ahniella affigens]AVP97382.1 hypothetical protein C7S18_09325 [Ahniella affigens]
MQNRHMVWGLVIGLLAGSAIAQDPLAGEDPDANSIQSADWWGDARLWYDHVTDLAGRDDVERARLRLRSGWRGTVNQFDWGITFEGAVGSDGNELNRINLDNERIDDLNLDEFYGRWNIAEGSSVQIGKAALPIELSPMLFDPDLRPLGVSVLHSQAFGDFNRWSIGAGYFAGDHLYGDESRLAAVQVGVHFREGMDWSWHGQLAYLDWSDIDVLAVQGLGRTNQRIQGGNVFRSDYRIVDLQLGARGQLFDWPFRFDLDLARNTGVEAAPGVDEGDLRDAARVSAVLGDRRGLNGVEVGVACQRIQRDAVLAAFSDDEWWFHSFSRGCLPWVGYGISDRLSTRLAFSQERRDDQPENVERLLLDLEYRW